MNYKQKVQDQKLDESKKKLIDDFKKAFSSMDTRDLTDKDIESMIIRELKVTSSEAKIIIKNIK